MRKDEVVTLSISEFTSDAVALVGKMSVTGKEILLTHEGRVVARVVPAEFAASARVSPIDSDWGNEE